MHWLRPHLAILLLPLVLEGLCLLEVPEEEVEALHRSLAHALDPDLHHQTHQKHHPGQPERVGTNVDQ